MDKKHIFHLLFLMLAGGMSLQGQLPKTDFSSRGALMDDFFLRLQTKISYSFSESARHFSLIWESAAKKGESAIREKASSLTASGQEKVKELWKDTRKKVSSSLEEGKETLSASVKDSLRKGKEGVDSAVEEKKYP